MFLCVCACRLASAKGVSISLCGYRVCILYRCIFHGLLIIHLCLFQYAAIKVWVKCSEFCLKSWWDSASHLQSLQSRWERHVSQLAHLSVIFPSQFTSWQSCTEIYAEINKVAPLLLEASVYKIHIQCKADSMFGHMLNITLNRNSPDELQKALKWSYAEQRKMLFEHVPSQLKPLLKEPLTPHSQKHMRTHTQLHI